jgi:hypothetical protein
MKKKGISTATYMLSKPNGKAFGGIKGYVFLPDFNTEIKFFLFDDKLDQTGNIKIDNSQVFNLDIQELEILNKGFQYIETNVKVLIELAKKNRLNENAYFKEEFE